MQAMKDPGGECQKLLTDWRPNLTDQTGPTAYLE